MLSEKRGQMLHDLPRAIFILKVDLIQSIYDQCEKSPTHLVLNRAQHALRGEILGVRESAEHLDQFRVFSAEVFVR